MLLRQNESNINAKAGPEIGPQIAPIAQKRNPICAICGSKLTVEVLGCGFAVPCALCAQFRNPLSGCVLTQRNFGPACVKLTHFA
jgi:hypothetical protein